MIYFFQIDEETTIVTETEKEDYTSTYEAIASALGVIATVLVILVCCCFCCTGNSNTQQEGIC